MSCLQISFLPLHSYEHKRKKREKSFHKCVSLPAQKGRVPIPTVHYPPHSITNAEPTDRVEFVPARCRNLNQIICMKRKVKEKNVLRTEVAGVSCSTFAVHPKCQIGGRRQLWASWKAWLGGRESEWVQGESRRPQENPAYNTGALSG